MSFTIDEMRDRLRNLEDQFDRRDPATRFFSITSKERNQWLRQQASPTATVKGRVEDVLITSIGGGLYKVSLKKNAKTTNCLPNAVREAVERVKVNLAATEENGWATVRADNLRTILDHLKEVSDEQD